MKIISTLATVAFFATVGTPCKPQPQPTPRPTLPPVATPTETPTPTEKTTPIPLPVETRQLTRGKAIVRFDMTNFVPKQRTNTSSDLDSYGVATLVWSMDRGGTSNKLVVPALELGLRGLDNVPCASWPCPSAQEIIDPITKKTRTIGPHPMGVTARFSANTKHDFSEPDEHRHCGEGVSYGARLPIGAAWPVFDVAVEWDETGVKVSSPMRSVKLVRGSPSVGFGEAFFAIPSRGIGWVYKDEWTAQKYGGAASLLSWAAIGVQPELAYCP